MTFALYSNFGSVQLACWFGGTAMVNVFCFGVYIFQTLEHPVVLKYFTSIDLSGICMTLTECSLAAGHPTKNLEIIFTLPHIH